MAPSLAAIAESIQRQAASKWLWHSNHLAARLGISVVELKEFLLRIQSGGSGVRKYGTWSANPAPYDRKINTREQVEKLVRISKLLMKGAWSQTPAAMLKDKVKVVFPNFWKSYKKY